MTSESDDGNFGLSETELFFLEWLEAKAGAFVVRIKELITPRDMYLFGSVSAYHNSHCLSYMYRKGKRRLLRLSEAENILGGGGNR